MLESFKCSVKKVVNSAVIHLCMVIPVYYLINLFRFVYNIFPQSIVPVSSMTSSQHFARNEPLRRSSSYKDKLKPHGTGGGALRRGGPASSLDLPSSGMSQSSAGGIRESTSFKHQQSADQSVFNSTPDLHLHGGSTQGMNAHSTPTADGSLFAAPNPVDVSLIGPLPSLGSLHAGPYGSSLEGGRLPVVLYLNVKTEEEKLRSTTVLTKVCLSVSYLEYEQTL